MKADRMYMSKCCFLTVLGFDSRAHQGKQPLPNSDGPISAE